MDTPQEPTVAMVGLTERERESAVAVASLAGVGVVPEGAAPDLVIAGEGAVRAPGSSAPRVSGLCDKCWRKWSAASRISRSPGRNTSTSPEGWPVQSSSTALAMASFRP